MTTVAEVLSHLKPHLRTEPTGTTQQLPEHWSSELRELLSTWDGAEFDEGLSFATGVIADHDGVLSEGTDSLAELWSVEQIHAEARRHAEEDFVPPGLLGVGYGLQHSIIFVSTRDEDRGTVFYWEWYWRYPWNLPFFKPRILESLAPYDKAALDDPDHPQHQAAKHAANAATLTTLGSGLFDWLLALGPQARNVST